MTNELEGVRVAFVVANEGIEEIELTEPWAAVLDVVGPRNWSHPGPVRHRP